MGESHFLPRSPKNLFVNLKPWATHRSRIKNNWFMMANTHFCKIGFRLHMVDGVSLERGTPESLTLLPYGPRFPVDPGKFFLPTSLSTLVAAFGALISGWKRPFISRQMSSQEAGHVSLIKVTPTSGKGTLGTWWFHFQRGGRTQSRPEPPA
jgi:hypothetical protein